MNKINQDGLVIEQTDTTIKVNGKLFEIPSHVQSISNTTSVINGKITINGYELNPETGEFIGGIGLYGYFMVIAIVAVISCVGIIAFDLISKLF